MQKHILDPASVKTRLQQEGRAVEDFLRACLTDNAAHKIPRTSIPDTLRHAMEYSLLAGGKRLRPVLCLMTARMCGLEASAVMPFAGAIEMIHTYSLIHDDLPAMDDDDLRRGKPSCHKQFDEATAILAGDALLTDAFAFMCATPLSPAPVLAAIHTLACAAGASGMVGGQVLDMGSTGKVATMPMTLTQLRHMHSLKTGALIKASCVCGALLGSADTALVTHLEHYGAALGVAFQITDDILDVTADTETLGKPAGSDEAHGKTTYPALLGLDRSRELAAEQKHAALASLEAYDSDEAAFLRGLAAYVVERSF